MNPILVKTFCETALKRILMNGGDASPKISASQLLDAVNELNLIKDSWDADGSMIYSQQFYTFPLVGGQQTYTIGANTVVNGNNTVADFNTLGQPRPSYLEFASFEQTNSNPVADLPMRIVDAAEWASIVSKQIYTSVGFYVYLDGAWPHGNLSIWPAPSISANIVLTTWLSLGSASSESDYIILPPGYARGLSIDLSIAMAPYYGKSSDPAIQQLAGQLRAIKNDIGWVNIRGGRVQYSSEAQSTRGQGGAYDIISDQIR